MTAHAMNVARRRAARSLGYRHAGDARRAGVADHLAAIDAAARAALAEHIAVAASIARHPSAGVSGRVRRRAWVLPPPRAGVDPLTARGGR